MSGTRPRPVTGTPAGPNQFIVASGLHLRPSKASPSTVRTVFGTGRVIGTGYRTNDANGNEECPGVVPEAAQQSTLPRGGGEQDLEGAGPGERGQARLVADSTESGSGYHVQILGGDPVTSLPGDGDGRAVRRHSGAAQSPRARQVLDLGDADAVLALLRQKTSVMEVRP